MPNITEIESAIIARLNAEIPYLRACGPVAEFLARDMENIQEMALICPAAFVVYSGARFGHKISGVQDREMVFSVLAVVRNLRKDGAVLHGAAGEKGVYDLLEDIRAALTDQNCGIAMDPLLPESEQAVIGSRDFAIFEIEFRTRCRFRI